MPRCLYIVAIWLSLILSFPAQAQTKVSIQSISYDGQFVEELKGKLLGVGKYNQNFSKLSKSDANFVLGYTAFVKGDYKKAISFFEKVDSRKYLEDSLLYFTAKCQNKLGMSGESLKSISVLQKKYPKSAWVNETKIEKIRGLILTKKYAEAIAEIDRIFKIRKKSRDRELLILKLEALLGLKSASSVSLAKTLVAGSGSEADLVVISRFFEMLKRVANFDMVKWLVEPSNQYQLVSSFAENSHWDEVSVRLEALLKRKKINYETLIKSKWLLAKAYRWTQQYDNSIAIMNELLLDNGWKTYAPSLRLMLATVYAKKNDYEKAISIRKDILKNESSRSRRACYIAYKVAYLYMDQGDYTSAIKWWKKVLSMKCRTKDMAKARWFYGFSYYKMGSYSRAVKIFDVLLKREAARARIKDRVLYWKGKALDNLKRGVEAKKCYNEIVEKYPFGYYAKIAKQRILSDADRASFTQVYDPFVQTNEYVPKLKKNGNNYLNRAVYFDRLGLSALVIKNLRAIDLRKNGDNYDYIMWLADKNYANDLAYRMARSKYKLELKSTPDNDKHAMFVWKIVHPEAFMPAVDALVKISNINSYLVWSIMKNESTFRPTVVSPAGAVGLMQLMPTTAANLAGGKHFNRNSLYSSVENIYFGIDYLNRLSAILPHNLVGVIASYNAGEEAVLRWLGNGDMSHIEEWIEEIPYSETNLYVKKVMASYWNYQRLYGPTF